jgi:hypothetical protein
VTAPMSRAKIAALPPTIDLPTLGRALGVCEPVIRERARRGELESLGIKVVKLGAQYRVITASVWAFLGIQRDDATDGANSELKSPIAARHREAITSALRPVRGERC